VILKTDWWGERQSAWLDDAIVDAAPLDAPLRAVLSAMATGSLAVVNPLGAVVFQNKRSSAGLYARVQVGATDSRALSAPALVRA